MTTPSLLSLPLSPPIPGPIKRKRVLLVDASPAKRELRSEAMRKLGMDVDCACDICEARSWWRADLYSLVLINLENDLSRWDEFCADIRVAAPPQRVAFLVGKPGYLSESPNLPAPLQTKSHDSVKLSGNAKTPDLIGSPGNFPLQWGIMEASRRISAVRSVSAARSMAIRNRPTPPRDLEPRPSRRASLTSLLAVELRKEELL
jgi:CheY-like chemotaxis protein